jgi:XTP/dITP diphosphohydrolase
MRLSVATTNPGKLRDFAGAAEGYLLRGNTIEIGPLQGLEAIPAPAEDEPTFAGNAVAKAVYYSKRGPGRLVLADDSGLEVDALEGQPGVRSARFAEDAGFEVDSGMPVDERNNALLISLMAKVTFAPRTARYRCGLALARSGRVIVVADGTVEGRILTSPRGTRGFGYDPLFYVPEYDMTMAELDPVRRMKVSHRGRALRALLDTLTESPHLLR